MTPLVRLRTDAKQFASCPATNTKTTSTRLVVFVFVAGPGIEPGSGGSVLHILSYVHGLSHVPCCFLS